MWTAVGLVQYLVFFVLDLATRRVEIAGIAPAPTGLWMSQVARNLVDEFDGFLNEKRYLIHDRDPLYTQDFRAHLSGAGRPNIETLVMADVDLELLRRHRYSGTVQPWNDRRDDLYGVVWAGAPIPPGSAPGGTR